MKVCLSVAPRWSLPVLQWRFSTRTEPGGTQCTSGRSIQRLCRTISPSPCLPSSLPLPPLALRTPPPRLDPPTPEPDWRAESGQTLPAAVTALMASWTVSPPQRMRRGPGGRGVGKAEEGRGTATSCWTTSGGNSSSCSGSSHMPAGSQSHRSSSCSTTDTPPSREPRPPTAVTMATSGESR